MRTLLGDTLPPSLWSLRCSSGQHYAVNPNGEHQATAGRDLAVEIPVLDAGISRHHACFRIEDDCLILEDLNSQNGTFVNGRQIRRETVRAGDIITLGRVSLLLTLERADSNHLDHAPAFDDLSHEELVHLLTVSRSLAGAHTSNAENLRHLVDAAMKASGAREGRLLFYNDATDTFATIAARPDTSAAELHSLPNDIAKHALRERRPCRIERDAEASRHNLSHTEKACDIILVPVRIDGRATGLIYLKTTKFSVRDHHLEFLAALAWVVEPFLTDVTRETELSPGFRTVSMAPPMPRPPDLPPRLSENPGTRER